MPKGIYEHLPEVTLLMKIVEKFINRQVKDNNRTNERLSKRLKLLSKSDNFLSISLVICLTF